MNDPREALEVLHQIAPQSRSRWPLVVLALAMILLALTSLRLAASVNQNTKRVHANNDAIRVSCTLLANVIVQSGGGTTQPNSPAEPPTPQQRLNTLYVGVITNHMTTTERHEARRLARAVGAAGGGALTIPDCRKVTQHPEDVTAIQVTPQGR